MQQDNSGKTLGTASVCLAVPTVLIQLAGGLCCGWIGWPLGLAAIVLGIIAIVKGERTLGAIGIFLSVAGIILQAVGLAAAIGLSGAQGGYSN